VTTFHIRGREELVQRFAHAEVVIDDEDNMILRAHEHEPAWGDADDTTIIERCDRPQRGVSISMLLTLKEASMAAGSPSMAVAWWSLLIGSVVGVPSPRRPTTPRQASHRMRARRFAHTKRTLAYPPFARKYGMKCSACHLAVPLLTPLGRHSGTTGTG